MRYDYQCACCSNIWEVEKPMSAPGPAVCPSCGSDNVARYFGKGSSPPVLFANRPPWTYKECLKYKDCKHNNGPRTKIDPSKHGDLGAWNCPGEVIKGK